MLCDRSAIIWMKSLNKGALQMILQTKSFCSRYASNRHAKQYLVSHYFTHRHGDGIFSHQLVFFLIYFGSEHLLKHIYVYHSISPYSRSDVSASRLKLCMLHSSIWYRVFTLTHVTLILLVIDVKCLLVKKPAACAVRKAANRKYHVNKEGVVAW